MRKDIEMAEYEDCREWFHCICVNIPANVFPKKILNGIVQVVLINVKYYSIISKYTAFFLKKVTNAHKFNLQPESDLVNSAANITALCLKITRNVVKSRTKKQCQWR